MGLVVVVVGWLLRNHNRIGDGFSIYSLLVLAC